MNMKQTINITIDNKDRQGQDQEQDQKQKQDVSIDDGPVNSGNNGSNDKVKVTSSARKSVKDVK